MSGVEGWIDWHGGENPVPGLVVQVQWRDQSARYTPDAERCSDEWSWGHHDMYCDIIAYRVVTPAALSAIEGGGGALQPSASVPTEQADGGVVAALETACRVLRGIPKPRTNDGVSIVYSVSDDVPEDIYTAQSYVEHAMFLLARATPPATPIAGGLGSSPDGDTHRVAETAVVGDRVWVVTASQGEYSDRSEWCVEAHTTEAAGQAAVERLDAEDRAKKVAEKRAWYCDDVTYYLSEVPLLAAPASDTPTRDEPEASEPKDAARRDEEAGQ